MRLPLIRFASVFVFFALFVKADAFAQLTKLNVGYVGIIRTTPRRSSRATSAFTRAMGFRCS